MPRRTARQKRTQQSTCTAPYCAIIRPRYRALTWKIASQIHKNRSNLVLFQYSRDSNGSAIDALSVISFIFMQFSAKNNLPNDSVETLLIWRSYPRNPGSTTAMDLISIYLAFPSRQTSPWTHPPVDTPPLDTHTPGHPPGQTSLLDTPKADTPFDTPPGQTPPRPPRWPLKQTVRILLECILAYFRFVDQNPHAVRYGFRTALWC